MPFVPYAGMTWMARRVSKRQKQSVDISELLLQTAQAMASMHRWSDVFTAAIESQHYFSSHRVILVTKALAEALYDSKIDFCLKHLRLPYSVFEICFEEGMNIPGTNLQAPGVLVVAKPSQAAVDAMDRFLTKATGASLDASSYRKLFSMRYTMPEYGLSKELNTTYVFNVDFEANGDKEIEEVIQSAPDLANVDAPLNEEEKRRESSIMRLVVGALCYLSIENAEKGEGKPFNRPRMGIPPSCTILGRTYTEIARHMRKGHIRHLRHQRYEKAPDGSDRIVWVREHEVGGGQQNELLSAKKELIDAD